MIHEIIGFLRGFPPFDTATEETLGGCPESHRDRVLPCGLPRPPGRRKFLSRHTRMCSGQVTQNSLTAGESSTLSAPGTSSVSHRCLPISRLDSMCAQRKTCSSTASDADAMLPVPSGRSGLGFAAETVRNRLYLARADDQQGELASPALSDIARPAVVVEATVSLRHVVRLMHQEDASSAV